MKFPYFLEKDGPNKKDQELRLAQGRSLRPFGLTHNSLFYGSSISPVFFIVKRLNEKPIYTVRKL